MRALCGAIITAGAMIGLGLTSIGIGHRYSAYPYLDASGNPQHVWFRHLDTALMFAVVALGIGIVIGLGIAFAGLAYHHHRRYHEMFGGQKPNDRDQTKERITV
jgi:hypothetical protein